MPGIKTDVTLWVCGDSRGLTSLGGIKVPNEFSKFKQVGVGNFWDEIYAVSANIGYLLTKDGTLYSYSLFRTIDNEGEPLQKVDAASGWQVLSLNSDLRTFYSSFNNYCGLLKKADGSLHLLREYTVDQGSEKCYIQPLDNQLELTN